MKILTSIFIIAVASLVFYAILTWTGYDDKLAAFIKGDYVTAEKQFREAAERGEAEAQYHLALMYDGGKGVPQDDAEAMAWYRKAADQGYAPAQYNLGMMYYFGKGVPQDYVAAYTWTMLADTHGESHATDAMPAMAEKMSAEQIAAANAAARAWMEEHHGKPPTGASP